MVEDFEEREVFLARADGMEGEAVREHFLCVDKARSLGRETDKFVQ